MRSDFAEVVNSPQGAASLVLASVLTHGLCEHSLLL